MAAIGFRELAADDLPTLYDWLSRPHVRRWYSRAPTSFAEVAAKYGPRIEEGSAVKAYVLQVDNADAGYIQAYFIDAFPEYERTLGVEKGVAGIDLFIADEWRTRHGLGTRVIRQFVEDEVFGRYGALACVAGPVDGNVASIRAFEKAGFNAWKRVTNEHGEHEVVMRVERDAGNFRIEPIDLIDVATCIEFRRDMYVAAFGSDQGLEEEMGFEAEKYLAELREKIAGFPEGNVHLWHDERIVGQLEMRLPETEAHLGYLSLLFVAADQRGRGLGRRLHDYAIDVTRHRGRRLMRLSVSLTNVPAIMFYRRLGWRMAGTKPHREPMAYMELDLDR